MIIGIVGGYCSGKDTVADYLMTKGFNHISLSDIIRDEARRRGIEITRDNLIRLGNELRVNYGKSILADRAITKIEPNKDYIITSIRNKGEIESLRKKDGFVLLNLDAPIEIRFLRMIKRSREEDPKTLGEFKEKEDIENSENENNQQIHICRSLADYTLYNDTSKEDLIKKIDDLLIKLKPENHEPNKRPDWDEYFMNIAKAVASRSTCDRGKVGCVIAKDKQILVTGYAGSPKGLPHCDEVGHQMKTLVHEDGTVSQHCMRTTHAEQNAICQAAKLGISIDGSTLYCKMTPCLTCAKSIINAGIKKVICESKYHQGAEELLKEAGIDLLHINEEVEKYENQ